MAELVRVEPTKSHVTGEPDGSGWFIFDDGRQYHRKLERGREAARSDFPTPYIRKDGIDPCRGMDGKIYDSLSGLRNTYGPEGNPQGERYTEIGNEEIKPDVKTFDRRQRRDDIKAAIEDVKNGRLAPPPVVLEDM